MCAHPSLHPHLKSQSQRLSSIWHQDALSGKATPATCRASSALAAAGLSPAEGLNCSRRRHQDSEKRKSFCDAQCGGGGLQKGPGEPTPRERGDGEAGGAEGHEESGEGAAPEAEGPVSFCFRTVRSQVSDPLALTGTSPDGGLVPTAPPHAASSTRGRGAPRHGWCPGD